MGVADAEIKEAGLEYVARLTRLRELDLSTTEVSDRGVALLGKMTQLRSLNLQWTPITNLGLSDLQDLIGLRMLSVNRTRVGENGMKFLRRMEHLENLDIGYIQGEGDEGFSDKGLKEIATHHNLVALDLSESVVTDAGLESLRDLRRLKKLNLSYRIWGTVAGAPRFAPPNRDEIPPGERITGHVFHVLRDLPELEYLIISGRPIGGTGFAEIAALRDLRELDISDTDVRDLAPIAALPSLKTLWLMFCPGIAGQVDKLRGSAGLQQLSLDGFHLNANDFSALRQIKHLRNLHISGGMLPDDALAHIAECQGLEELFISGDGTTEHGLEQLCRLKSLKKLELYCRDLKKGTVERIRKRLPDCEVKLEPLLAPEI